MNTGLETKSPQKVQTGSYDAYTALLGLAALALAGTVGAVCLVSHAIYGTIFSIVTP